MIRVLCASAKFSQTGPAAGGSPASLFVVLQAGPNFSERPRTGGRNRAGPVRAAYDRYGQVRQGRRAARGRNCGKRRRGLFIRSTTSLGRVGVLIKIK